MNITHNKLRPSYSTKKIIIKNNNNWLISLISIISIEFSIYIIYKYVYI